MTARTRRSRTTARRSGRGRKILLTSLVIVAVVAALATGGWFWTSRAQGTPQAVEFADATLSPQLTEATVLALGEATHGNAEFQNLRTGLLAKAVDHGFRTVVLEEDHGATREVDAFVQGGPGTAAEAAGRFGFRINMTREVADWLQWMRDYNAQAPEDQRIRLVGMDMQRTEPSLRIVSSALAETAPQVAARATAEGDGLTAATLAEVDKAVKALPESERTEPTVAVTALRQYLDLQAPDVDYATVRDQHMFTNLKRIVAETQTDRGADSRGVVVMAHDAHVAKQPSGAMIESVGHLAAAEWGEKYQVIGTDFHRTRFLSGVGEDRQEWSLTNRTPLRGMYEGTQGGYLEIAATTGKNRELFDEVVPMGSAGEAFTRVQQLIPFMHTLYVIPSDLYDAVILVDEATPVTML